MSTHQQRRVEIIMRIGAGEVTSAEAAELLGITARQLRRARRRFIDEGVRSVVHGNTGREPANRTRADTIERLRALCGTGGKYHDFNVSHLADVLARDEGLDVTRPTLARLLVRHDIRSQAVCARREKRQRRERQAHEGALLQIDGSPHDWLEGRAPKMALVGAIDDATGKIIYACFRPSEHQAGYFRMLREIALARGLPLALYHDRHTILRSPKALTIDDQLAGRQRPMSDVQAALDELGIGSIAALSPQAKGRVERLWRTLQDRLTKELRVADVSSLDAANRFLPAFIAAYNARFAHEPRDPEPAWRALPDGFDPDYHFAARDSRLVRRDHTLQWLGRTLQIAPDKSAPSLADRRVHVHTTPEGEVLIYDGARRLTYRALDVAPPLPAREIAPKPPRIVDPEQRRAARRRRFGWLFTTSP